MKRPTVVYCAPLDEALPSINMAAGSAWGDNWQWIGVTEETLVLTSEAKEGQESLALDGKTWERLQEMVGLPVPEIVLATCEIEVKRGALVQLCEQTSGVALPILFLTPLDFQPGDKVAVLACSGELLAVERAGEIVYIGLEKELQRG